MNVLGISGTPRKNGNSEILLRYALRPFDKQRWQKIYQPSFSTRLRDKPFGMVDLQNGVAFVAAHLGVGKHFRRLKSVATLESLRGVTQARHSLFDKKNCLSNKFIFRR